ncbi:MAG: amidase, partial [Acidobacteria bacterium]|nr:amidase [Acidobacteriota bacterium]
MEEELAAIRRWEGTVRALVDWDPDGAGQRYGQSGGGPLSGWSLGVKDIIDVQGMPTRCNVDYLPETPAREHAGVVGQLLSLGAFVLSKT